MCIYTYIYKGYRWVGDERLIKTAQESLITGFTNDHVLYGHRLSDETLWKGDPKAAQEQVHTWIHIHIYI